MLSKSETGILRNYLALSPCPEDTFTYDELLGYFFGLAITPEVISPGEWQPLIFGGHTVSSSSPEQTEIIDSCLTGVLNRLIEKFQQEKLFFPFDINILVDEELEELYEWISGFEEAIALREEIWDPEEYGSLPDREKEELYHSLITVQGLVDPFEVMEFLEQIPDEVFQEAFPEMVSLVTDRDAQIQLFLLSNLPYAIDTLMQHAQKIDRRQQRLPDRSKPTKRSKVIEVDFRRSKKQT